MCKALLDADGHTLICSSLHNTMAVKTIYTAGPSLKYIAVFGASRGLLSCWHFVSAKVTWECHQGKDKGQTKERLMPGLIGSTAAMWQKVVLDSDRHVVDR